MKEYDHTSRENYDLGLARIRASIEQNLIQAGAQMMVGCISLPAWRQVRRGTERISVVPCNGPKMTMEFTFSEIVASRDGVEDSEVRKKIGLYVAEYARFRESKDKFGLLGGSRFRANTRTTPT